MKEVLKKLRALEAEMEEPVRVLDGRRTPGYGKIRQLRS